MHAAYCTQLFRRTLIHRPESRGILSKGFLSIKYGPYHHEARQISYSTSSFLGYAGTVWTTITSYIPCPTLTETSIVVKCSTCTCISCNAYTSGTNCCVSSTSTSTTTTTTTTTTATTTSCRSCMVIVAGRNCCSSSSTTPAPVGESAAAVETPADYPWTTYTTDGYVIVGVSTATAAAAATDGAIFVSGAFLKTSSIWLFPSIAGALAMGWLAMML